MSILSNLFSGGGESENDSSFDLINDVDAVLGIDYSSQSYDQSVDEDGSSDTSWDSTEFGTDFDFGSLLGSMFDSSSDSDSGF